MLSDSPFAFISILGNRLTCYAEGNPFPSIKWLLPSGKVVSDTASIFLKPDISENGIYTCRAASPLKPDSVATLAVQKARDLRKYKALEVNQIFDVNHDPQRFLQNSKKRNFA